MKRIFSTIFTLFIILGIALGQTTEKKATAPAAKAAQPAVKKDAKKTTAPAATKATTTTKTKAAQKVAPAKKAATKAVKSADTVAVKLAEPVKAEATKTDTAASPTLKAYAKSKVDEAKATKDTLINSGAEKVNKVKENLGEKIKNFNPFKSKADSTKK